MYTRNVAKSSSISNSSFVQLLNVTFADNKPNGFECCNGTRVHHKCGSPVMSNSGHQTRVCLTVLRRYV